MGNKFANRAMMTALAALLSSTVAEAATDTDVEAVVAGLLTAKGPFPVKIVWYENVTHNDCVAAAHPLFVPAAFELAQGGPAGGGIGPGGAADHDHCHARTVRVQHSRIDQQVLTASNLEIVSNDQPQFGTIVRKDFPQVLVATRTENLNCSGVPGVSNISLSLQVTRSFNTTTTRSVTKVRTKSVGWGVTLGSFNVNSRLDFSNQATSATAQSDGTALSYTISRSGTVQMPPRTRTVSTLSSYRVETSLPFTLRVTVDGDLSDNEAGKRHLSDLLTAAERTFPVTGTIVAEDSSEGRLTLQDAPFNTGMCGAARGVIARGEPVLTPATTLKPSKAKLLE